MALIPFAPAFPWELSLAFRKDAYLSTVAEALIRHLQAHFLHHL